MAPTIKEEKLFLSATDVTNDEKQSSLALTQIANDQSNVSILRTKLPPKLGVLPIPVLLEILSHLPSSSLLALARTNKHLRSAIITYGPPYILTPRDRNTRRYFTSQSQKLSAFKTAIEDGTLYKKGQPTNLGLFMNLGTIVSANHAIGEFTMNNGMIVNYHTGNCRFEGPVGEEVLNRLVEQMTPPEMRREKAERRARWTGLQKMPAVVLDRIMLSVAALAIAEDRDLIRAIQALADSCHVFREGLMFEHKDLLASLQRILEQSRRDRLAELKKVRFVLEGNLAGEELGGKERPTRL